MRLAVMEVMDMAAATHSHKATTQLRGELRLPFLDLEVGPNL